MTVQCAELHMCEGKHSVIARATWFPSVNMNRRVNQNMPSRQENRVDSIDYHWPLYRVTLYSFGTLFFLALCPKLSLCLGLRQEEKLSWQSGVTLSRRTMHSLLMAAATASMAKHLLTARHFAWIFSFRAATPTHILPSCLCAISASGRGSFRAMYMLVV